MNGGDNKSILLLCQHAPYGHGAARDALDVALAFGAFEQSISLLFVGDGAWCLAPGQDADPIAAKTLSRMLSALELYGVEDIAVSASALSERQLPREGLAIAATVLDDQAVAALLARQQMVISL